MGNSGSTTPASQGHDKEVADQPGIQIQALPVWMDGNSSLLLATKKKIEESPASTSPDDDREQKKHAPREGREAEVLEDGSLTEKDLEELFNALPIRAQRSKWCLLYNSKRHGRGLNSFFNRCCGRGPTLIIIRDTKKFVFGAYADTDWNKYPKFYGNSSCFLFQLRPHFRIYRPSLINENFQFFNFGNQFNKYNGLAMGGNLEQHYFAFSIENDFESGKSFPGVVTFVRRLPISQTKSLSLPPSFPPS